MPAINIIQCTNVPNESAKTANDALNFDNSRQNLDVYCFSVTGSHKPDLIIMKELPAHKISIFANEKANLL